MPDEPGRLAEVLKTVASSGGNVVQIAHHRGGFGLPFGTVEIDVSVETRDAAHADQIRSLLAPYLAT